MRRSSASTGSSSRARRRCVRVRVRRLAAWRPALLTFVDWGADEARAVGAAGPCSMPGTVAAVRDVDRLDREGSQRVLGGRSRAGEEACGGGTGGRRSRHAQGTTHRHRPGTAEGRSVRGADRAHPGRHAGAWLGRPQSKSQSKSPAKKASAPTASSSKAVRRRGGGGGRGAGVRCLTQTETVVGGWELPRTPVAPGGQQQGQGVPRIARKESGCVRVDIRVRWQEAQE